MSDINLDLARPVLDHVAPESLGISLEAMPLRGMVTLRGDLADAGFASALQSATGCAVPALRKTSESGEYRALWMSPDELMIFCPYGTAGDLVAALTDAAAGAHMLAVDMSDARAVFRLSGDKARFVIAKGAPVDLSPGAFVPGDVRRTRLSTVAAGITMIADDPVTYEVFCFRSYAAYMWNWFVESADAAALNDLG